MDVTVGLKEDCLEQTSEGCLFMLPDTIVEEASDLGRDTVDDDDWLAPESEGSL